MLQKANLLRISTVTYFIIIEIFAFDTTKCTNGNNNKIKSGSINYMSTKTLSKKLIERSNKEENKDSQIVLPEKLDFSNYTTRDKFQLFNVKGASTRKYIHYDPIQELYQFRPIIQPSTSSFIEFHYMDNFDNNNNMFTKNRSVFRNYHQTVNIDGKDSLKYKIAFHPPYFILRLNDATCKTQTKKKMFSPRTNIFPNTKYFFKNKDLKNNTNIKLFSTSMTKRHNDFMSVTSSSVNIIIYDNKTYTKETESRHILSPDGNKTENIPLIFTKEDLQTPESTIAYDRIKFFEIYDRDTDPPSTLPLKLKDNLVETLFSHSQGININNSNKNSDQNVNLIRYVKKHITDSLKATEPLKYKRDFTISIDNDFNSAIVKKSTKAAYMSSPAIWTDYPFVGVYIYEPTQVRCDCASISPHWLVASATCLYRHKKNLGVEGRSAFIAYCGNNWRRPRRIVYVRRSLLHPRFKPNDENRRKLYNMGIIQVANSMSNTCNGWQPIALMSHQFVANRNGTLATAVGWGLDRYDVTYTESELPTHTLMLYKSSVYTDSCPGNLDYSKATRLNEEGVKNVYCLSLPTYVKEDDDPVHGGLLLVEGKLIALYLQEERRPLGEQSAQYTGIWRLIPWLLDVAREIDEQDP